MSTATASNEVHQGHQLKVGSLKHGIHSYDVLLNKLRYEYDVAFHSGKDKVASARRSRMLRIESEKKKLELELFTLYAEIKKNTGLSDITHLVNFTGDENGNE